MSAWVENTGGKPGGLVYHHHHIITPDPSYCSCCGYAEALEVSGIRGLKVSKASFCGVHPWVIPPSSSDGCSSLLKYNYTRFRLFRRRAHALPRARERDGSAIIDVYTRSIFLSAHNSTLLMCVPYHHVPSLWVVCTSYRRNYILWWRLHKAHLSLNAFKKTTAHSLIPRRSPRVQCVRMERMVHYQGNKMGIKINHNWAHEPNALCRGLCCNPPPHCTPDLPMAWTAGFQLHIQVI